MDHAIKKAWVEALRSGKYTQGRHHLRKRIDGRVGYCCLGVLCELHRLQVEEPRGWEEEEPDGSWEEIEHADFEARYLGETVKLPIEVQDWAGVPCEDPLVEYGDLQPEDTSMQEKWEQDREFLSSKVGLSILNDCGFSFTQIAKLIEEQA